MGAAQEDFVMEELSFQEDEDLEECIDDYVYLHRDGRVVRTEDEELQYPEDPGKEKEEDGVKYKDEVIDQKLNVWARIYLPSSQEEITKKAVVVFYPGGGFFMFSPRSEHIHKWRLLWASRLNVIIVSVNYRLAPEHRLPAAYNDAERALEWIISDYRNDDWLRRYADMSKVFVMGESAGGNIAHRVGVKARDSVKGVILLYPLFGGETATQEEKKRRSDGCVSMETQDVIWRLALPRCANQDHVFCNPMIGEETVIADVLLVIAANDLNKERHLEYAEVMRERNVRIETLVFEGEDHGFCTHGNGTDPSVAKLVGHMSTFIYQQRNFPL